MNTEILKNMVELATSQFTHCDWEMDAETPEILEAYNQRVIAAASEAAAFGRAAILLAQNGAWEKARDMLRNAVDEEAAFGDSPAWGPPYNAVCRYLNDLAIEESM